MKSLLIIVSVLISITNVKSEETVKKIDKIEVYKHDRELRLLVKRDGDYDVYKSYPIMLSRASIGHKVQEGDKKTPEGKYIIDYKNSKSKFHLSLHVSYPNKTDREYAKSLGVSPGGDIMVHGIPNTSVEIARAYLLTSPGMALMTDDLTEMAEEAAYGLLRMLSWTDGCIAVSNKDMREIFGLTPNKTPIEIFP